MRVLGLDPGSIQTGFAILELNKGPFAPQIISSGTILLDAKAPLSHRLRMLSEDLENLLKRHKPESVALESLFFSKNAMSALKLGHARGVILLKTEEHGSELVEFSPAEVKKAVAGSGRSSKDGVARALRLILKLPSNFQFTSEDHSDAVALGLCYCLTLRFVKDGKAQPAKILRGKRGNRDRSTFWQTHL